ncbi:Glycogen branching enzyme, GH-57-type, archaeal [hydrothermal vent metagenome]|uniref:Glycogen branching enzyme, GH-57-type, archaeal n=1 Tax=hydrothermal vent metagenome TaxID=652676 RepID=A0A3B0VZP5_9ZZZZ
MKNKGYFSLVLHAHLPYVLSHGTWPHGADWLNEAAAETYIPLIRIFEKLRDEGISAKVSIDISPVLTEMLADAEFKTGFKAYLKQKVEAASHDIEEFTRLGQPHMTSVACVWKGFYGGLLEDFTVNYHEDILSRFRTLQDQGHIEIFTCGATHGYFPLLSTDESVQAQVKQAVASYKRHFGRAPRGIWLPECAYRPSYMWKNPMDENAEPYMRKGVEEFLSENGIEYFYVDSHLLEGGTAVGVYHDRFDELAVLWDNFESQCADRTETGTATGASGELVDKSSYKVYLAGSEAPGKKPVAVFTRDNDTGLQVWSGEWGYPGDPEYLDFHKKRFPGGLRYWRVTGAKADLAEKEQYHPDRAAERIKANAEHFADLIKNNLAEYMDKTGEPGIVVSPYDAELFGHWWFEGVECLYHAIKRLHHGGEVTRVTAGEYLDLTADTPREVVNLPEGSWGEGGYHWVWLNDMNKWSWPHIYEAEAAMKRLAASYSELAEGEGALLRDVIKQAARELMILQASDWQFLISTKSAADYAEMRITRHFEDFKALAEIADNIISGGEASQGDRNFVEALMRRDNLFPDIDPLWYKEIEHKPCGTWPG